MNQRTRDLLNAWMSALNARRLDDVLAFYAEDATLLPTFSPHALSTSDARRRYFEQLAARPGLRVFLHDKTLRVNSVAGGLELATGIYRFEFDVDEEPLAFEARFSFVIAGSQARPILLHHSSQIPRTLS